MTPPLVVVLWRRRRLYAVLSACMAGYYLTQGAAILLAPDALITGGVYDSIGHLAPGSTAGSMRLIAVGFVAVGIAYVAVLARRTRTARHLRVVWAVSAVVAVTWTTVFVAGAFLGWVNRATGPATYGWLYLGGHVGAILEPSVRPTTEAR